jgi:hypothetical protein
MEYELTAHAEEVIANRKVRVEWIEHVLLRPSCRESDKVDPDLEHRLGRIAEYGDRVLRVVANVQVKPIRVVTVFFDRRARADI